MRYSITLSYDGSAFCGWQIQPNAPSVQQTVEDAISTLLGTRTSIVGAGRTDTGVNARGYIAHFDHFGERLNCADFCYKLNAILPKEIAVSDINEVPDDFHARFGAKRREYTYYIHRKKDPFVSKYSYFCAYPELDFEAMNRAAGYLTGTHDFSCFEKAGSDNKTSVCTIFEAGWSRVCPEDENRWQFHIAGDRFLRNMVRAIVGTLIEVGRGRRSAESMEALIENGTRSDSGESVPGNALFLSKIDY